MLPTTLSSAVTSTLQGLEEAEGKQQRRTVAVGVGQAQIQLRDLVHLVHRQARHAVLFSVAVCGDKRLQAADLGRS